MEKWPRTEAVAVTKKIVQPPPKPIEPESWWKSCWFNPKRKKDIYDLPNIRQYDTIG